MAIRLIVIGVILAMAIPAVATHDAVADIEGCNRQFVDDTELVEIRWTSSFKDEPYGFAQTDRNGPIVQGDGNVLEVTVQWSVHQREDTTSDWGPFDGETTPLRADFRPPGFTPSGVDGGFVDDGSHDPSIDDPSDCGVDQEAKSYGNLTFNFTFTDLHKPANRGGRDSPGEAKGNAELNVFVSVVGGPDLALGTNLHVVTDPYQG